MGAANLPHHNVRASVELPALLVVLLAEAPFLSVRNRVDPAGVDPLRDEKVFGGIGASITQRKIVPFGTAFIAVTFDRDANSGTLFKCPRVAHEGNTRIFTDIIAIIIKEGVFDAAGEKFGIADGRQRRRRYGRRDRNRDSRFSYCIATGSRSCRLVGSGRQRTDGSLA